MIPKRPGERHHRGVKVLIAGLRLILCRPARLNILPSLGRRPCPSARRWGNMTIADRRQRGGGRRRLGRRAVSSIGARPATPSDGHRVCSCGVRRWGGGRQIPPSGGKSPTKKGRVAPRVGFEPTTSRLTAGCSTTELPRNRCSKEGGYTTPLWGVQGVLCTKEIWRPGRESNSGARICNPLRNHSATRPRREQKMSRGGRIAIRRAADGQCLARPHCNGVKPQHISAPA